MKGNLSHAMIIRCYKGVFCDQLLRNRGLQCEIRVDEKGHIVDKSEQMPSIISFLLTIYMLNSKSLSVFKRHLKSIITAQQTNPEAQKRAKVTFVVLAMVSVAD